MAGGLMRDNPEAAKNVLIGQAALLQNPKLAPKEDEANVTVMVAAMPITAFSPAAGQTYDAMMQSARASYAAKSLEAGDQSGELNPDRWTQVVNEVTGGFVEYNGKQVIAPEYGMPQNEFDSVMDTLSMSDIDGATLNGRQVDLATFKEGAILASYRDGQYMVQLKGSYPVATFQAPGPIPAPSVPYLKGVNGKNFILDFNPQARAMKSRNAPGGAPIQPVDPFAIMRTPGSGPPKEFPQ
jgi:hypothetical protein